MTDIIDHGEGYGEKYPTWKGFFVLALALVILGAGAFALMTFNDHGKKSAPKLSLNDRAGLALKRDFNKAYAGQIAITRVVHCEKAPAVPSEFACAVVVTAPSQAPVCGGIVFSYVNGVTAPKSAARIDPKYCA